MSRALTVRHPRPLRGRRRRAAAALLGCALAAPMALAGCGGDDQPSAHGGARPSPSIAATPATSPLTGLPVRGPAPRHPVLAVKIDNSGSSSPQLGLGAAGMVTEELVEGGITRLAAFYYQNLPDVVGPVRSMRATDIGIVQPLDAALVASGAAGQTVTRVRAAGIPTYVEGAPGFFRDTARPAPYNLFVHLGELARTVKATSAPGEYLPFGTEADLPRGRPARVLRAAFSGSSATSFEFRDGVYVNTDTNAAADDQFRPASVLVLRVRVGDAGYLDPAGNPVPETRFTGTGPAMLFHGGRVVRGTWSKDGLDADVSLSAGGAPLKVPAGKVWVELVPRDGGSVTVSR